ncbi:MAG: hypothetical protein DPW14_12085 [Planctomycetes bacterium]|nr:hypothetical protein [Planctomycetota bacterium]
MAKPSVRGSLVVLEASVTGFSLSMRRRLLLDFANLVPRIVDGPCVTKRPNSPAPVLLQTDETDLSPMLLSDPNRFNR